MIRARTKRREILRLREKEIREYRKRIPADLVRRVERVDAAVNPRAAVFWGAFRARLATWEKVAPVRTLEATRQIAADVLREAGYDLDGVVLKPIWTPPVLIFEVNPDHAVATKAVEDGRGTPRVRDLRQRIAALSR